MMPYFNPYQYQPQYAPQPIPQGANTRLVSNFSDIQIGDIPTDGTPTFFIKNDLTEIQTRKWSNDGRVISTIYRPIEPQMENLPSATKQEQNEANALSTEDIMKRLDEIDARLDKLLPKRTSKKDEENI